MVSKDVQRQKSFRLDFAWRGNFILFSSLFVHNFQFTNPQACFSIRLRRRSGTNWELTMLSRRFFISLHNQRREIFFSPVKNIKSFCIMHHDSTRDFARNTKCLIIYRLPALCFAIYAFFAWSNICIFFSIVSLFTNVKLEELKRSRK